MAYASENSFRRACWDSKVSKAELEKLMGVATVVKSASLAFAVGAMTDNGNATGYIDFAAGAIPANSIVIGWKFVTTAGFTGDTSAVVQIGVAGALDKYSAVTNGSVYAPGTVGSVVKTTGSVYEANAVTPRVTITSAVDFTAVKTAGVGAGTATVYYIPLS